MLYPVKIEFKDYPSGSWQDWSEYLSEPPVISKKVESENEGEAGLIVFDDAEVSFRYESGNPVYSAFSIDLTSKQRYLFRISAPKSDKTFVQLFEGIADFSTLNWNEFENVISFSLVDKLSALNLLQGELTRVLDTLNARVLAQYPDADGLEFKVDNNYPNEIWIKPAFGDTSSYTLNSFATPILFAGEILRDPVAMYLTVPSTLTYGLVTESWIDAGWNKIKYIKVDGFDFSTWYDETTYHRYPVWFSPNYIAEFGEKEIYGIDILNYNAGIPESINGFSLIEVLISKAWSGINFIYRGISAYNIPLSYYILFLDENPLGKTPLDALKMIADSMKCYLFFDRTGSNLIVQSKSSLATGGTTRSIGNTKIVSGPEKKYFWDKLVDGVTVNVKSWVLDDVTGENLVGVAELTKQPTGFSALQKIKPKNSIKRELLVGDPSIDTQEELNTYAAQEALSMLNFYGLRHSSFDINLNLDDNTINWELIDNLTINTLTTFFTKMEIDLVTRNISLEAVEITGHDYDFRQLVFGPAESSGSSIISSSSSGGGSYYSGITPIFNLPLQMSSGIVSLLTTDNLKLTSDQLDTAQPIKTTDTPTFNQMLLSAAATLSNHAVRADRTLQITTNAPLTGGGIAVDLTANRTWTIGINSANLIGTTNQINVANGSGVILGLTNVTLSLPQNIHTGATPTFNQLTLSSAGSGSSNAVRADRLISTSYPLTGGGNLTADKTLGLSYNTTNLKLTSNQLNTIQDITTSSHVTFERLTSNVIDTVKYKTNTVNYTFDNPAIEFASVIHGVLNNKMRFIVPDLQEESEDGTTWVTSSRAPSHRLAEMMRGEGEGTIYSNPIIPYTELGGQGHYRLTWNASSYVHLSKLYMYVNTFHIWNLKIEAQRNVDSVWVTILNNTGIPLQTPGHIFVPHTAFSFRNHLTDAYGKVRITFSIPSFGPTAQAFYLYAIEWLGTYPYSKRNVESYDIDKNVTFPNKLVLGNQATGLTHAVRADRLISTSYPLTGGGNLTADRTLGLGYNSTNLKLTSNQLNTIQDIATTSSPTFAGLTINGNILQTTYSFIKNDFIPGWTGQGWQLDYGLTYSGDSYLEIDNLRVRGTMNIYELVINQIRATNGSLFVSSVAKVKTVVPSQLYDLDITFEDPDNLGASPFALNDILLIQRVRLDATTVIKKLYLKVENISNGIVGVTYQGAQVGSVEVGDTVARIGNTLNTNRQGTVYLTSDDAASPYIDIYDGVTGYANWATNTVRKVRLGKLTGLTDSDFGNLTGYGLYTTNAYLKGGIWASFGNIAGWTITSAQMSKIYTHPVTGEANEVALNATSNDIGLHVWMDKNAVYVPSMLSIGAIKDYRNTISANEFGIQYQKGSDTYFRLTNSIQQIAGWNFNNLYLWKLTSGTPTSSPAGGIVMNSNGAITAYGNYWQKRVALYYSSATNWGLIGTNESYQTVFQLGYTNQIAGWVFDTTKLTSPSNYVQLVTDYTKIIAGSKAVLGNYASGLWGIKSENYQFVDSAQMLTLTSDSSTYWSDLRSETWTGVFASNNKIVNLVNEPFTSGTGGFTVNSYTGQSSIANMSGELAVTAYAISGGALADILISKGITTGIGGVVKPFSIKFDYHTYEYVLSGKVTSYGTYLVKIVENAYNGTIIKELYLDSTSDLRNMSVNFYSAASTIYIVVYVFGEFNVQLAGTNGYARLLLDNIKLYYWNAFNEISKDGIIFFNTESSYLQMGKDAFTFKGGAISCDSLTVNKINGYNACRFRGRSSTYPSSDMRPGDIYYNTSDGKVYIYNGNYWQALT